LTLPAECKLPEAESEHGTGLFIMRSVMDEVAYLRSASENRLILRKARSKAAEEEKSRLAAEAPISQSELEHRLRLNEQAMTAYGKRAMFPLGGLACHFQVQPRAGPWKFPWRILPTVLRDLLRIAEADWFVLRLTSPDRQLLNVKTASQNSSFIGTRFLCGERSQCNGGG